MTGTKLCCFVRKLSFKDQTHQGLKTLLFNFVFDSLGTLENLNVPIKCARFMFSSSRVTFEEAYRDQRRSKMIKEDQSHTKGVLLLFHPIFGEREVKAEFRLELSGSRTHGGKLESPGHEGNMKYIKYMEQI